MATLSLALDGNTRSRNFPDADRARLRTAWRIRLGLPAGATSAQIYGAISDWAFNELISEVLRQDQNVAAKAAQDAVAPIALS